MSPLRPWIVALTVVLAGLSLLTIGKTVYELNHNVSQTGSTEGGFPYEFAEKEIAQLHETLEQEIKEKERLQAILEAAGIKYEMEGAPSKQQENLASSSSSSSSSSPTDDGAELTKGQGTKSHEEPSSTRNDLLEQRVCIDIKKFKISEGKSGMAPSPTCKSWFMEGAAVNDEDGYVGDIFFPPNRESAMKQFEYLNDLILEFLPARQCKEVMSKGPLRNYKRSDASLDVVYPAMWGDELEMLFKTLINLKPKTYYEWGPAVSVDNFKPWCDKVAADPFISCLSRAGIYKLGCFVPEGQKQAGWGIVTSDNPGNDRAGENFINSIDHFNISRYDAILVDGRFREACAMKALNYVDSDRSIVMFHDFWSRWEKYEFVLKYYNPIGRSRTIGILRRKPVEELPDGWRTEYKKYSTLAHQS